MASNVFTEKKHLFAYRNRCLNCEEMNMIGFNRQATLDNLGARGNSSNVPSPVDKIFMSALKIFQNSWLSLTILGIFALSMSEQAKLFLAKI